MRYPLKIKASRVFIEELYEAEYGAFEDKQNDIERAQRTGDWQGPFGDGFAMPSVCEFLGRWKTQIEVRNVLELEELYFALASGTIGVRGYAGQANRILDQIRPEVRARFPDLVKSWPRQMSY
ncbi:MULTISPECIES: hypothetical protein [unclassified Thioalkalivibrio]|uniref:hypothetical protein n=1 Tax=unclassified Thioalkalivibrio TaxID=2621013 RepID=UPI00037E1310|nr:MULTISPECIES: hypothetical protein [unclassified Thioalkalivibrio]